MRKWIETTGRSEEDAIAAVIAHDIKPGDAVFIDRKSVV